jgi:hypothetical protein
MYGLGNYSEGGISPRQPEPSVRNEEFRTRVRTNEGKAAKSLVAFLDKMSFDTAFFVQMLVIEGGMMMRRRVLDIAIGIVKEYARQWELGISKDEVSRDAMRLKDTLDQFKM